MLPDITNAINDLPEFKTEEAKNNFIDFLTTTFKGKIDAQMVRKELKAVRNTIIDQLEPLRSCGYYDALKKYILDGNYTTLEHDNQSYFFNDLIQIFCGSETDHMSLNLFLDHHWEKFQIDNNGKDFSADKKDIFRFFEKCYEIFCAAFINQVPKEQKDLLFNIASLLNAQATQTQEFVISTLQNQLGELKKQLEQLLAAKTPTTKITIQDQNDLYEDKYKDPLFLDRGGRGEKAISLADVYVDPKVQDSPDNTKINEIIKEFAASGRNNKLLLLYGLAGVGKSSLVQCLIANHCLKNCHVIALRDYVHKLNSNDPWKSIKVCFTTRPRQPASGDYIDDNLFHGKFLILDGLDEVCVLKQGFNGKAFLEYLAGDSSFSGSGAKILVTSRSGYFDDVSNKIQQETIFWGKDSVETWCKKYSEAKSECADWCENFMKNEYPSLNDNQKSVLCTPIILYIACNSGVTNLQDKSIAKIYDESFKKIGHRYYDEMYGDNQKKSEQEFSLYWQYAKELAFQMLIHDRLSTDLFGDVGVEAITMGNDLIAEAKKHTKRILNVTQTPEAKKLFAIFHFAHESTEGIEFAHKTVGEYFAAVKLYEDYFENLPSEDTETIWKNIFQAFRYINIPGDVMTYLADMMKERGDNYLKAFYAAYYQGMKEEWLWKHLGAEPEYEAALGALQEQFIWKHLLWTEPEYNVTSWTLQEQFNRSFRFLTELLTCTGFKHDDKVAKNDTYQEVFRNMPSFEYCKFEGWNFEGFNLDDAQLNNAKLSYAKLNDAKLNDAKLNNAELNHANLIDAKLSGAKLNNAELNFANLYNAKLNFAELSGAKLNNAELNYANLYTADLYTANLSGADLSGADLTDVEVFEFDLPQFDEHLKDMACFTPIVYDDDTGELITDRKYNPKTNRME